MSKGPLFKERIWVLVKAYPQSSNKYEETVCCAGVTEDGNRFLRLYPIRYRRLPQENRFSRYQLVEAQLFRAEDFRPESHKVVEDSIRVVQGAKLSEEAKVRLWLPHIADSLSDLKKENQRTERSLGIIKPDPDSVQFIVRSAKSAAPKDQAAAQSAFEQQGLFESPLRRLEPPEYAFCYRFTSAGREHLMQIHDWEVQAAWHHYKQRYRTHDEALEKLRNEYGVNIPRQNLHLLMGTMKAYPRQFLVIGVLRSKLAPGDVAVQEQLPL